jgi:hypothetical protein
MAKVQNQAKVEAIENLMKNWFNLMLGLLCILFVAFGCTNPGRPAAQREVSPVANTANNIVRTTTPSATPSITPTLTFIEKIPSTPSVTPKTKITPGDDVQEDFSGNNSRTKKQTGGALNLSKGNQKPITSGNEYITGPRGGCYYMNSRGNKTYVDHSFCGR